LSDIRGVVWGISVREKGKKCLGEVHGKEMGASAPQVRRNEGLQKVKEKVGVSKNSGETLGMRKSDEGASPSFCSSGNCGQDLLIEGKTWRKRDRLY